MRRVISAIEHLALEAAIAMPLAPLDRCQSRLADLAFDTLEVEVVEEDVAYAAAVAMAAWADR